MPEDIKPVGKLTPIQQPSINSTEIRPVGKLRPINREFTPNDFKPNLPSPTVDEIVANVETNNDNEKQVIKNLAIAAHEGKAKPEDVSNAILTFQGKHSNQEGGKRYYMTEDNGIYKPIPLGKEEQPPKEKNVGKIFEDSSWYEDFGNSIAAGAEKLAASVLRAPGFILDLTNPIEGFSPSTQLSRNLGLPDNNRWADALEAQAKEQKSQIEQKYDKGITDYISNGEYGKAVGALSNAIAESLPTTLALAASGGLGASGTALTIGGGAVFGAAKKHELDEENTGLSEDKKNLIALGNGLAEGFFEQFGITKLGALTKEVFKKQGKDAAKIFAEKSFKEVFDGPIIKILGVQAGEMSSEAATQFAQNAIDKYSGYKPDKDLSEGVVDAALVGLGAAAGFAGVAKTVEKRVDKDLQKENERSQYAFDISQKGTDAINAFKADIDNSVKTGEVKPQTAEKAKFMVDLFADYHNQTADLNLDDQNKRKVFDYTFAKSNIETQIKGLDPEKMNGIERAKYQGLKTQAKELQESIDKIVLEAQIKQETTVSDKTLEKQIKLAIQPEKTKKEGEKPLPEHLKNILQLHKPKEEGKKTDVFSPRVENYSEITDNKFKPENQLKFNQGTSLEPVRIVSDEKIINLIKIGAKINKAIKEGKIPQIDQKQKEELEKELGISATEANANAKKIARSNRDSKTEKIVVIDENSLKKGEIVSKERTYSEIPKGEFNHANFIARTKHAKLAEHLESLPDKKMEGKIVRRDYQEPSGKTNRVFEIELSDGKRIRFASSKELESGISSHFRTEHAQGRPEQLPVGVKVEYLPSGKKVIKAFNAKTGKFLGFAKETLKGKSDYSEKDIDQLEHIGTVIEQPLLPPDEETNNEPIIPKTPVSGLVHTKINNMPVEFGSDFKTWDLGKFEGKNEQEHEHKIDDDIINSPNNPVGETGESFNQFRNRVITRFIDILNNAPNNTVIVTHSSVLKMFHIWNNMGRPDIHRMTKEQVKEFSHEYTKIETKTGDVERFKSAHGHVIVVRHGETEDNLQGKFRSENTELTEKGVEEAKKAAYELKNVEIPQIISSNLPRAQHTVHELLGSNFEYPINKDQKQKSKIEKSNIELEHHEGIQKVTETIQKALPKVKVIYNKSLKAAGVLRANGTIEINPYYAGIDTPIHEAGHVLIDAMGYDNSVIQAAIKQLRETNLYKETKARYPELNEEMLDKEVLAEAIGREGAGIFDEEIEKNRFVRLLNYIFDWFNNKLGLNKNIAKSLAKQIIGGIGTKNIEPKKLTKSQLQKNENDEIRKDITDYDILKDAEENYIDSGETRIDDDYESDDAEHYQRLVYIPIYHVIWDYQDSSGSNDINEFDSIDDAYEDAQSPDDYKTKHSDHYKYISVYFKPTWIDNNNDIVDEDNEIDFYTLKNNIPNSNFVKNFKSGDDNVYHKDFGTGEDDARELEQHAYFNLGKDIISKYENDNGVKLNIEGSTGKKYSYINVTNENGDDVGTIQLRISDHTYNPKNNDSDARSGNFISVEIANKNETKDRFHTSYSLQYDGSNNYDEILYDVDERIKEIIDSWNIQPEQLQKISKFNEPSKESLEVVKSFDQVNKLKGINRKEAMKEFKHNFPNLAENTKVITDNFTEIISQLKQTQNLIEKC